MSRSPPSSLCSSARISDSSAFLLRAGWIADLLSVPVTTGFLAGISIHILISQLPALLGLPSVEGSCFYRIGAKWRKHWRDVDPATLAIGVSCLATIVIGEKISPVLPAALIALVGAALAVRYFDLEAHGVAVLGAVSTRASASALPRDRARRSFRNRRPRHRHRGRHHGADGGDLALLSQ